MWLPLWPGDPTWPATRSVLSTNPMMVWPMPNLLFITHMYHVRSEKPPKMLWSYPILQSHLSGVNTATALSSVIGITAPRLEKVINIETKGLILQYKELGNAHIIPATSSSFFKMFCWKCGIRFLRNWEIVSINFIINHNLVFYFCQKISILYCTRCPEHYSI